ncbi:MAG: Rid family detoxifying hydrolase [Defluviitaleaceae bacterium]|nr:Rid family detoxifying hydrolase [Defluviitaleaceae bacterium]
MNKNIISTESAPAAIGPYSQGISTGSMVFTSGQLPIDVETGHLEKEDIAKATELVIKNVISVVRAGGSDLEKIIKTTIYLVDMADFAAVNKVYGEFFKENQPARTTIQVCKLPLDVKVEIEAIAII